MAGTPGARRLTFNSGPLWRWLDERLGLQDLAYPVPAHANSVLYVLVMLRQHRGREVREPGGNDVLSARYRRCSRTRWTRRA